MPTKPLMEVWLESHEQVLNSLPHPSGGALDAEAAGALRTWDRELAKMQKAFATALQRRNELAPISALPAELLARVFSHLAESWPVNSYDHTDSIVSGGWARVVLVCRSWRTVAIDCASLWATVSLNGNEPIDMFLERAKACSLSVIGRFRVDSQKHVDRAERLLGYPDRLENFDVDIASDNAGVEGPPTVDTVFFRRLVTQSNLETLSVRNDRSSYDPSWESNNFPTNTNNHHFGPSRTFISTTALRLATICVEGYLFPWGAGSSRLRSLTVGWAGLFPPTTYTILDVLESLRSMPALEQLILTGCVPDPPHQTSLHFIEGQSVVSLPRLHDLQLSFHNESGWVLWTLLDISPLAKVTLHSRGYTDPELVVETLSRHIQRPRCPEYTGLTLWQTLPNCLGVGLSIDARDESSTFVDVEVQFESDLSTDLPLRLLQAVPLKHVEAISIRGVCYTWSTEDIRTLFASATRLRHIKLRGTPATRAFCSLLFPDDNLHVPPDETNPLAGVPLPSLTDLHIDRVNLKTSVTLSPSDDAQLSLGGQLTSALGHREALQRRLLRLSVKRSAIDIDWVSAWKSFVTDVDWDGEEDGSHAVEEEELTERYGIWTPGGHLSGDELDLLGDNASLDSLELGQDGLSEVEEEDEEDHEDWE